MKKLFSALLINALLIPLPAYGAEFIAAKQAVKVIADGQPWSAQISQGPGAKIILNPDGTGTFKGPLTLSLTWEVDGDDVCLNLGFFVGRKCVRFAAIEGGFEGYAGNKVDMRLTR